MATTSLVLALDARAQSIEHLQGNEGVALSNDGRYSVFNGTQGYYHTPDGTHQIPRYSNFISAARAISGDGQVVVGTGRGDQSQPSAFRWSLADGLIQLGTLGTDPRHESEAYGVSGDGSRIVGTSETDADVRTGFVWVQGATGGVAHNQQMYELEAGEANSPTVARAISDNGNVAVGRYRPNGSAVERAMRWDLTDIDGAGGLVGSALGDLTGGNGFSMACRRTARSSSAELPQGVGNIMHSAGGRVAPAALRAMSR
ncbi:hypothetical protein [Devosia limi]|nr:hypothetical protein [Devosia limi]